MESKTTPGPWVPVEDPAGGLVIEAKNGELRICLMCSADTTAEEWADAHLIAATPALLEACQTYVELCRELACSLTPEHTEEIHRKLIEFTNFSTGQGERVLALAQGGAK